MGLWCVWTKPGIWKYSTDLPHSISKVSILLDRTFKKILIVILQFAVSLTVTLTVFMCCFRPYTPMKGAQSHVWFDRHKISQDCPEHLESIDSMCNNLSAIVQDEIRAGIPKHRMIIGTVGSIFVLPLSPPIYSPSIFPFPITFFCLTHSTCSKLSRVSDHCS